MSHRPCPTRPATALVQTRIDPDTRHPAAALATDTAIACRVAEADLVLLRILHGARLWPPAPPPRSAPALRLPPDPRYGPRMDPLLHALDLAGTIAFALSGATLAVRARMDLFGVLVLAIVTAVSGGILRDLLIGAIPPASIADWRPIALAAAAGLLCFLRPALPERLRHPVQLFDAAGLGVFAATGAQLALNHGLNLPMSAVLGMVTGIGGGIVRDVLTARVPVVFQAEIYAVAALAGAAAVVLGHAAGLPATLAVPLGAALCLFLRLMALYRGWRLPIAARGTADPAPGPNSR